MPRFDDDDDLYEEYQRYAQGAHGVPEDYDTWLESVYGGTKRRRSKKHKPGRFDRDGD
jgi:hypothetical protein